MKAYTGSGGEEFCHLLANDKKGTSLIDIFKQVVTECFGKGLTFRNNNQWVAAHVRLQGTLAKEIHAVLAVKKAFKDASRTANVIREQCPWIAGNDRYLYKTEGSTEFRYEKPWLRYDVDKQANTWNDTWLVVAYGYEGGDAGKPTHSPMFTLETDNRNDLTLQINNDHFLIVQMVESTDGEGNPIIAYTKHGQSLSITGSSEKQTTNFYIVPVSDAVMQDPYVKVFLTEIHSGDGLPPQNIPFNHNLPGDEDHTSILIYNPGRAEYVANMNNHKASSSEQPTQYWLEEEG